MVVVRGNGLVFRWQVSWEWKKRKSIRQVNVWSKDGEHTERNREREEPRERGTEKEGERDEKIFRQYNKTIIK